MKFQDIECMHGLIMVMSGEKGRFYSKLMDYYEMLGGFIFFICTYIFVHSSAYLFVCGDDRVTCYSGADDVAGEPGST